MILPIQSVVVDIFYFILGPPSATLSCVQLSGNTNGTVNVTVSWTLSVADSTNFYLISITTTDPIWGTSEHQHCQCHTVWTDWFHERLWVQHHSTWCQLWESGGKAEWAPDNHSSRYVFCKGVSKSRNESKWKPHPQKDKFPASTSHRVYFLLC